MKNKINIIGLLLSSIFILSSCNETEEIGNYNTGAEPILKTTAISTFDVNQTINIEYFLNNVSITNATYNDSKISDHSLTINGNIATFNTSIKDSLAREFNIKTMLSNGLEINKTMKIAVHDPVTISDDTFIIEEDVDVKNAIVYTNKVSTAIIDKTTAFWKKGKNGTFTSTPDLDLNVNLASPGSKDSINLRTFDYTTAPYSLIKRDTLFLRVVSESGILKDTVNTKLIFSPQFFVDYSTSETLTSNTGVNLLNGETVDPDLYLNTATDILSIENSKFKYINISNETEAYKTDLFAVEDYVEVYDKYTEGTETSDSILTANLKKGDLFIYSVERTVKKNKVDTVVIHYGLLSVVSITDTNVDGVITKSVKISSKEGEGVKK